MKQPTSPLDQFLERQRLDEAGFLVDSRSEEPLSRFRQISYLLLR